jgi:hypothetical protein
MDETSLSVAEIYRLHGFSAYLIDVQAGVPAGTTNRMMQNIPVSKRDAQLVLTALSVKTKQQYNLNNVAVKLLEEA